MKKLLKLILKMLTVEEIDRLDARLSLFNCGFTSDFQRKPSSVKEVNSWKATELRYFLLYAGAFVLKGVVNQEKYDHFILFHCGISILLAPNLNSATVNYARTLLRQFVYKFAIIYGRQCLIFNLHCVIHLADDCDFFQEPLDVVACFIFEDWLGDVGDKLRPTRYPLSQIKARFSEMYRIYEDPAMDFQETRNLDSINPLSSTNSVCMIAAGEVVKVNIFIFKRKL